MTQYTMTLGGELRVIEVGKFLFEKYFGEISGQDPLNPNTHNLLANFETTVNMIFAGLRVAAKDAGQPFSFTREQVSEWVGDCSREDITNFLAWFNNVTKPKDKGEAVAQAEIS